jgi:aspartyl/glutamyl-tRNA(Asn/Gln) amidotransferase C subunit
MIEKDEVHALADLARITLTPEEVATLQNEITDIVSYVGSIQKLTTDTVETKTVGAQYNVFRADTVTNTARSYTDRLLHAAPHTHKNYVQVKQIINPDEA